MDIKKFHSYSASTSKRGGPKKKNFHERGGQGRLKGVQVVKPFVYGSLSWKLLPEQVKDCHTHQWIVYVRGYDDEDISLFIKCVQFKLHVSYDVTNRICFNPPYQVTETGWGEFEIVIRIHFKGDVEKPVTLYHYLKLLRSDSDGSVDEKKPIVSEFYDEFIFADPQPFLYHLLQLEESSVPDPVKGWIDHEEKKSKDLEKILVAKGKIKSEISDLRIKLAGAKSMIRYVKSQQSEIQ